MKNKFKKGKSKGYIITGKVVDLDTGQPIIKTKSLNFDDFEKDFTMTAKKKLK